MLEYSIIVKLLTEYDLEFLSLKGGCTGSSEYTLVKMTHCWKSHVTAQLPSFILFSKGFVYEFSTVEAINYIRYLFNMFFQTSKIFFGQVHYGPFHIPVHVLNLATVVPTKSDNDVTFCL